MHRIEGPFFVAKPPAGSNPRGGTFEQRSQDFAMQQLVSEAMP
jgi:hypothetical protein